jgi:hypothetical protein
MPVCGRSSTRLTRPPPARCWQRLSPTTRPRRLLPPPRARGFDDGMAVLVLPAPYRKRLRTTNGVERLHEAMRRRERVIRSFPNRRSALRLVGALLMEQDEGWTTGKRSCDMTAYWLW